MNLTIDELIKTNENIQSERKRFELKANDLNLTIQELKIEVEYLGIERNTLSNNVEEYKENNIVLESNIKLLNNVRDELNSTIEDLGVRIEDYSIETAAFKKENEELTSIVKSLDNSVDNFNDMVELVGETILDSRLLSLESLRQHTYSLTNVQGWVCNVEKLYGGREEFMKNTKLAIGESWGKVMKQIDSAVFKHLRVNETDFGRFIQHTYLPDGSDVWNVNMEDLVRGVQQYVIQLKAYYFTTAKDGGLTFEDWIDAAYNIDNLQPSKLFNYSY